MKTSFTLLICALLLSCGASDKLTRAAENSINGVWILKEVNYDTNRKGTYNISILDNIPSTCIEDTNWEFIANNNTGSYALSGSSCSTKGIQNFIWSVPKEMYGFNHSIILKPVNKKMKSVTNNKGYRMQLYELEATTMIWSYDTIVEGEKFTLMLSFTKQ
ncbi:lipocalin family protein [Aquimarina sp. 2201CG14-23]|uniref:lipocalin family protein n=1 Tax=Aquimarina mycalae TaxID=3040073 RepID=UPI0024781503|nr:lipocalin family protein [Aquimarina sp. 2201CG14-23]MDH7446456.1 lipocalin family protein [Aquimarina sp. 2201CG14-23]